MNIATQNRLAVVAGCVVITAVGAALLPVMKQLYQNELSFSWKGGLQVDHFRIALYGFLWNAVSGMAGGFVACWVAADKKLFQALLTGIIAFAILVLVSLVLHKSSGGSVVETLCLVPFALMGGLIRRIIENNQPPKSDTFDQ